MKELKGTKTEKNLLEAFAGESQVVTNIPILQARQRRTVLYR